jgi:hypothetical protein
VTRRKGETNSRHHRSNGYTPTQSQKPPQHHTRTAVLRPHPSAKVWINRIKVAIGTMQAV